MTEVRDRALTHIKRCDRLFDGNVMRPDREFAYQQMRVLALELLDELESVTPVPVPVPRKGILRGVFTR